MIINTLKTENMEQKVYPQGLQERIERFMLELEYLTLSLHDWKAIASNILRYHAEHEITDEVIVEEIELFYNA